MCIRDRSYRPPGHLWPLTWWNYGTRTSGLGRFRAAVDLDSLTLCTIDRETALMSTFASLDHQKPRPAIRSEAVSAACPMGMLDLRDSCTTAGLHDGRVAP